MNNLFVYGTLMYPEVLKALTGKIFVMRKAILYKHKRFKIIKSKCKCESGCECEGFRPYPAIVYSEGDMVEGVLLLGVDEESFKILDYFEDSEYTKQVTEVICEGKNYKAWVYVRGEDLNNLEGDWDKNKFEKERLDIYLNDGIPKIMEGYN